MRCHLTANHFTMPNLPPEPWTRLLIDHANALCLLLRSGRPSQSRPEDSFALRVTGYSGVAELTEQWSRRFCWRHLSSSIVESPTVVLFVTIVLRLSERPSQTSPKILRVTAIRSSRTPATAVDLASNLLLF
eukprot:scaffold17617_cov71-Cyclotella_meneghiniana.AAC.1